MKKHISRILIVFSVLQVFGETSFALPEVPETLCTSVQDRCSAQSREIIKSYFSGALPNEMADESLYVGSCYMINQRYDAGHEHFGYVYLKREQGRYRFNATFAFFFESNPYEQMTIEEARSRNTADSKQWIVESLGHWQADLDVNPPWQHFLRQNADGLIDMVGLWGMDAAVACRLKKSHF